MSQLDTLDRLSSILGKADTGSGNTIIIPDAGGNGNTGPSAFKKKINDILGKMSMGATEGQGAGSIIKGNAMQGFGVQMMNGLDKVMSHGKGFDDAGAANVAMNGVFDKASDIMMKIPGAQGYGIALKGLDFLGDASAKLGITNDGMTTVDQITQNGVGNLIGGVLMGNNIFTKKTDKFSVDAGTEADIGGSYGGTYTQLHNAEDLSDKKYGWMSGNAYNKAQKKIVRAGAQQQMLKNIDDRNRELQDMVNYGGDVARYAYLFNLNGGYNQAAMHVENGGKVEVMEVDDNAEYMCPFAGGISGYTPVVIEIRESVDDDGNGVLGGNQVKKGMEGIAGKIGREVATVRDEVLDSYAPEVVSQVVPEVYDDFAQVAEAAGGKRLREEVLDKWVPDVVDRVVPEVIERSGEAAERGAFEMKRRMVGKMTGKDIADIYDNGDSDPLEIFYNDVCRANGIRPVMEYGTSEEEVMPDMMDEVLRFVDGIMRQMADVRRGGKGMGMAYSSGMSRTETTRYVPGVGPVTVVEETRQKPRVEYFGPSYKAGGSVKARERIERQLDAPEIAQSSQMNTIPEGALHKERHGMELEGDCTNKGIPVLDIDSKEQEAEIERNEIIFNREVTSALEDLYEAYYDPESDDETRDEAAIEAGKLLTREIMLNTDDRTGLIDTLKKGGKMQDGGKTKEISGYDPMSKRKRHADLDTLVEYAESENPRFVQRLLEFPMIAGFDLGNGQAYGTHLLCWDYGPEYVDDDNTGPAYVYPQIMEDTEGSGRLKVWPDRDEAMSEALKRGDYLKMNPADAEWFTEHYKERYHNFMDEFDEMERYMRSHPDADPVMVGKYFKLMSDEGKKEK